jgi:hypothetical protein
VQGLGGCGHKAAAPGKTGPKRHSAGRQAQDLVYCLNTRHRVLLSPRGLSACTHREKQGAAYAQSTKVNAPSAVAPKNHATGAGHGHTTSTRHNRPRGDLEGTHKACCTAKMSCKCRIGPRPHSRVRWRLRAPAWHGEKSHLRAQTRRGKQNLFGTTGTRMHATKVVLASSCQPCPPMAVPAP